MDLKINDNNKFKNIFNNIDESIIIIKVDLNQIDYVNKKFLSNFQSKIDQIFNQLVLNKESSLCNCNIFKKLKNYFNVNENKIKTPSKFLDENIFQLINSQNEEDQED